jgi:hypothetical protein
MMRQRVRRAGFAELRNAFVRFGERHTSEFFQLDKEIEDFAGQFMTRLILRPGFSTSSASMTGFKNNWTALRSKQISFATGPPVE